jgi:hypothetical protein
MKSVIKKIYLSLLAILVLSFSSCDQDNPHIPSCSAEIISERSHFNTARILINNCEGVDYIIQGDFVYDVTEDLKIESGVTSQFENGAGLAIKATASINAIGDGIEPIVLQAENENAIGAWRGIIVFSDNVDNVFNHVTIKGAGSGEFNNNGEIGNLVVYANSKVKIDNCTFENSGAYGINSNYKSGEITSLMNNKFNNNNTPILIRANDVDIVDASNSFSGNTNSYVHTRVGSEITTSKIWQALSIPYQITSADFGISRLQRIRSNGRLTINPGVNILFETQTGLKIDNTATLSAIGTPSNKIIFSGVDQQAGSWDGIQFHFTQSPSNEISYATIEHAGSDDGAIYMWADPALNVNNVTINDVSNCAFYDGPKSSTATPNPNLTRSNITYNNVVSQYCLGN